MRLENIFSYLLQSCQFSSHSSTCIKIWVHRFFRYCLKLLSLLTAHNGRNSIFKNSNAILKITGKLHWLDQSWWTYQAKRKKRHPQAMILWRKRDWHTGRGSQNKESWLYVTTWERRFLERKFQGLPNFKQSSGARR